jgi:hypothetical protein
MTRCQQMADTGNAGDTVLGGGCRGVGGGGMVVDGCAGVHVGRLWWVLLWRGVGVWDSRAWRAGVQ